MAVDQAIQETQPFRYAMAIVANVVFGRAFVDC